MVDGIPQCSINAKINRTFEETLRHIVRQDPDVIVLGEIRLMSQLWQHSVAVAFGSRWLAERSGYRNVATECFMAGLFHDIGKLLILKVLDDLRRRGDWDQELPLPLVQELLGSLHGEQGGG